MSTANRYCFANTASIPSRNRCTKGPSASLFDRLV